MRSQFLLQLSRLKTRLTWPGVALMMLLQRTPLPQVVSELQFSIGPRLVHILKWVVAAGITTGVYNTITGATGDLETTGNTTVQEGENMQVAIRAERAVPETVNLEGDLPPGIISNIGEGGQVPLGTIAFSGIPTTAGDYPIKVTILTWEAASTYEGDPVFIQFTLEVTLEPPDITQQPFSVVASLGTTVELSVEVANPEGTTYQWQRNVGASLQDFADIDGETSSVYSVLNATPTIEGAYRVRVTKNDVEVIVPGPQDPPAFISVNNEPDFGSWQFREFGEDYDSEEAQALENPDGDAFTNAFEFLFDLDPLSPDQMQAPGITRENIGGEDYVVFTFPALIDFPDLDYAFESTTDLANVPWAELTHGLNGVIIELSENGTILKIPYTSRMYCRVKVDT